MFAHRPTYTPSEHISYALDLNAHIADLGDKLRRWQEEADAAAIDAIEEARVDAEHLAQLDREAEALRDGIESGDLDANGEPVSYDRYYGGL